MTSSARDDSNDGHRNDGHRNNDDRVNDLLRLMEISRRLADMMDLQDLLAGIEEAACEMLHCERATVFVHDAPNDELYSYVRDRSEEIRFPAASGMAGAAFRERELINTPDAYAEPMFNRSVDKKTGYTTRNILTSPLTTFDQTAVGVLQALNKREGAFNSWDETLMSTLSAQCAVALQRQFLLEEFAEKRKMERELDLACDIQEGLLPPSAPNIPGYDIAGWNKPADQTGGDFYDLFEFEEKAFASIADVTGHGISAALLASQFCAVERAVFANGEAAATGLTQVNTLLARDMPHDRFVTALVGWLDPKTHRYVYCGAGHGPVFRYEAATESVHEVDCHGPPIGVVDDFDYDEFDTLDFSAGDILFLCTDGFFEWEPDNGEAFGNERLSASITRHRELPAEELIQAIYRDLLAHVNGAKQADDLTAVIVKRLTE